MNQNGNTPKPKLKVPSLKMLEHVLQYRNELENFLTCRFNHFINDSAVEELKAWEAEYTMVISALEKLIDDVVI